MSDNTEMIQLSNKNSSEVYELKENEIKDVSLVETSHVFRYFGLTTT